MKALMILGKISLWVMIILLLVLILSLVAVLWNSPGKLPAVTDRQGRTFAQGISEKVYVEIGGAKQGMFLRGEDASKPVLLFLHGGPASPELAMMMADESHERLEKEFVVCYWDQRGAAMSYSRKMDPATINLDQLVSDAAEVTVYLQQRFSQEKIYLLGHSWGSYLGIKTIQKHPDHYMAYIGVGQISNQIESQKLAQEYMLRHAKEIGDNKALKKLAVFDPEGAAFNDLMNQYGIGIVHENPSMPHMFMNMLSFKGYTLGEKIGYIRGLPLSHHHLNDYVNDNLFESAKEFQLPVYILQGEYDFQVSSVLAKEYCQIIQAPDKQFYTFADSAHSPIWEEPEQFMAVIGEIIHMTEE